MSSHFLPANPKAQARLAGLAYLIIIICGIFAQIAVRGTLIDGSDAGATADAIRATPGLLGLGILADFVVYCLDIALALIFFRLFAVVDHGLAHFATYLRIAMSALLMMNLLNFAAPLILLGESGIAAQLSSVDAEQLSLLFLNLHNSGFILGLMMFGLYGLLLATLIIRSGFMPRLIGLAVAISGLSYLAMGVIHFALPELKHVSGLLLMSAALPEFIFTAWLLIIGLNREAWQARREAMEVGGA